MTYNILSINPGSTSTKIGIFANDEEVLAENISHSRAELAVFGNILEQLSYRLQKIRDFLAAQGRSVQEFHAIVGRGGFLRPIAGGVYRINEAMLADLRTARYGAHASNLGAILACELAAGAPIPCFIVDPVTVDELDPVARITGRPEISRRSVFHALNQKATAKRFAASLGRKYEDLRLIVAHLGGGISVGCHRQGRVVEVNNALDGEGPFSPERAGSLPAGQFAELISGEAAYRPSIARMLAGQGGLVAHAGTNDLREVEGLIAAGDKKATNIYEAMIYQIARSIAAAAIPVCGKVDFILLTGGIAHSRQLTDKVKAYVEFIAPVVVLPGENELKALAEGAFRVLSATERYRTY